MTIERAEKGTAKPKMLVLELWGLGDLAIATPFLRAACEKFDVTLLAKPHALGLQKELWPDVKVIPFTAQWTAFRNKYRFFSWQWSELFAVIGKIRSEKFNVVLSARWDPRDHLLMGFSGAKKRWGTPRLGSGIFLTKSFHLPEQHRYESWRVLARELKIDLPSREKLFASDNKTKNSILIHSGAAQSVRVWPLDRFQNLAEKLRSLNYIVKVACDSSQEQWWRQHGEQNVVAPKSLDSLFALFKESALFIGNDSGPGHLAAVSGVPTFTIFGPQLPELFIPLHRDAEWIEGKPCPYKPCSDYCRFPTPHCIVNVGEVEVLEKVITLAKSVFSKQPLSNKTLDSSPQFATETHGGPEQ